MIGGTFFYIASVIVLLSATILFVVFSVKHNKERIRKELSYKLLLIRIPKSSKDSKPSLMEEIGLSEQIISLLASIRSDIIFEVSIASIGEEINFYVSVPEGNVAFVSRSIEGLFEDASISEISDYNIFHQNGFVSGAYLKQESHYSLPIRTYEDTTSDMFSPILNGMSKINEIGEGVAMQILIRKAPDSYKKKISSIVNGLKKGASFSDLISGNVKSKNNNLSENKDKITDDKSLNLITEKISKPLFKVNYRVISSASNKFQADAVLDNVIGGFSQFDKPFGNTLTINKIKNIQKFAYNYSFRKFNEKESMILNSGEISNIFHFPTHMTLSPKINWLTSKEAQPPVNLPNEGTKIGETNYRGEHRPVFISSKDRLRHAYIIGQTGTGKSVLMQNMAIDDIRKGKGVAVIDPHGDLVDKIAGFIPEEKKEDVIFFSPGDVNSPIGLNMLEYDLSKPEEKTFIVNEMQEIFSKLFPDSGEALGPMFQQYMRNALLLLLEDMHNEPATLVEIPRVFTDEEYRNKKLSRISNPIVKDFWLKEALKAGGEASLQNMAPYITSKFNVFIANEYIRPIIGQVKSSINFRKLMDEGKILLIDLSKGKIGSTNAGLLGMIITGKILMAALSRVDIPESNRKDFNLYIDEFQNFTTESISEMLSEARKYHLSLTVAHQFMAQLNEKTMKSVLGNVGTVISFRVGVEDAEILEKQFSPVFSKHDLINLDNFNAYVKLLINNQSSSPFNIKTIHPGISDEHISDEIKKKSSEKHGKSRSVVDREIIDRLR